MNQFINKDLSHSLVIASTNKGKIQEFEKLFVSYPLIIIGQPNELEIEETGKSFAENASLKALAASKATGKLALADDSGLCVECLDGAPGVYSSRYANSDQERILKLLRELNGSENRRAFFSAALCIASPEGKILLEVDGRCDGLIVKEPRGDKGFGYDPIFEVLGTGLTFAEMTSLEKTYFSHRGIAFKALLPGIKKIFKF
ncbi:MULTISPECIES: RdgB/HAM1 family non-canonical purine NTP pyrophosphatase [unclassified Prochlorococcus]|uniref:RdgB/HAM1 family non-canonical purine NTP pyrophosphatase n=1 Tax=unclassified Prochlorococcus TaxID=2627481 RepID=UPI000533AEB2|nr:MULTISPECIES: RdgB/HAM1 family non-canonical purine NTP pyrophosphatase [unclassified Prochlorococcus]KGG16648.1 Nucleoside 5-triphosphatasee RdgB [Prochlorococcus sp. MIT 0602]KGG18380.1 Nucleoside 5-triphosphatasee RdgB [Prochlorococcus sp. MIT 0603]